MEDPGLRKNGERELGALCIHSPLLTAADASTPGYPDVPTLMEYALSCELRHFLP